MNHTWFKVTCGQDQDRMTTEGKSVQLFSQNIQLARLTAVNGNLEELCPRISRVIVALFKESGVKMVITPLT